MVVATIKYAKPSTPALRNPSPITNPLPSLQVRRRRRRCGRQDMSAHQLYHQQVSLGIRPHGLRQLRRDRHVSPPLASSSPMSSFCLHLLLSSFLLACLLASSSASAACNSVGLGWDPRLGQAAADCVQGLATSPIRSVSSILPDRRIMTVSDPCRTRRRTFSSSASPSPHPPRSRTSARNGSPKYTTTARACPA